MPNDDKKSTGGKVEAAEIGKLIEETTRKVLESTNMQLSKASPSRPIGLTTKPE